MVRKHNSRMSQGARNQSTAQKTAGLAQRLRNMDNSMQASITTMPHPGLPRLPEGMQGLPEGMQGLSGNAPQIGFGLPPSETMQDPNPNMNDMDDGRAGLPDASPMEGLAKPIYGPDMSFRKETIVKYVESVDRFKKKEPASGYLKKIQELTDIMMHIYNLINNETYANEEEKNQLSHRNSVIAEEKRALEKKYNDLMEKKFAEFKEMYENIYKLAISEQGINKMTLSHVLDTYLDYQKGRISHNAGTNRGLKFEKKRGNLPDDFFTYLPE